VLFVPVLFMPLLFMPLWAKAGAAISASDKASEVAAKRITSLHCQEWRSL
jgi:hypothetical protein